MKYWLTVALILVAGPALAAPLDEVDCSTIDLSFKEAGQFCFAGEVIGQPSGRPHSSENEAISIGTDDEFTVVQHVRARANSYFEVVTPKEMIDSTGDFPSSYEWTEPFPFEGYQVAGFRSGAMWCYAFLRYAKYAHGTPGYSEYTVGYYCWSGAIGKPKELDKILASFSIRPDSLAGDDYRLSN